MNDFSFYFALGWQHIITIEALDHILFIAALAAVYLFQDWKKVLVLVTAFTIGHTITLILSTQQLIEVNTGIVEFLIPCTIVMTAIANFFQKTFLPKTISWNYFLALFFGLIHGLAFANVLRMVLASDQNFALSMFSFSAGLELAQILIVLVVLLLAHVFISIVKIKRRTWVVIISGLVLFMGLKMAAERWSKSIWIKEPTSGKALSSLMIVLRGTY